MSRSTGSGPESFAEHPGSVVNPQASLYDGEPAPRRRGAAFALSLLAPGVGWAYLGAPALAVALNLMAVAMWTVFVVGWALLRFHPAIPALAFGGGWVVLLLLNAIDVAEHAERHGRGYVLRDVNHPLVYGAIALFSFWVPLAGLASFTGQTVLATAAVADGAGWPTLLDGDRVLLDRTELRARGPVRSELVAFADPDSGRSRIARVVGLPGDEVVVAEGIPFVNDAPLVHGELAPGEPERLEQSAGPVPAGVRVLVESDGTSSYPISMPRVASWGEAERWTVGTGEVFVLNDARDDTRDSRTFGPIPLSHVVGLPTHVNYRVAPGSDPPWFDALPAPFAASLGVALSGLAGDALSDARRARRIPDRVAMSASSR